jgi:hypothetical protein
MGKGFFFGQWIAENKEKLVQSPMTVKSFETDFHLTE